MEPEGSLPYLQAPAEKIDNVQNIRDAGNYM